MYAKFRLHGTYVCSRILDLAVPVDEREVLYSLTPLEAIATCGSAIGNI